jgi:hypothetical protein
MNPIISRNLTPLPPFPTREWGFQSLSPRRGEVWRGVYLYIKNFSNILLHDIVHGLENTKNKLYILCIECGHILLKTPNSRIIFAIIY